MSFRESEFYFMPKVECKKTKSIFHALSLPKSVKEGTIT